MFYVIEETLTNQNYEMGNIFLVKNMQLTKRTKGQYII